MAGFDRERETLEAHFKAQFEAAFQPPVPVQFENVEFKRPANDEWVRLSIVNGDTARRCIGPGAKRRNVGIVYVNIFVKANSGTKRAREIADKVATIMQEKTLASGSDWIETLDTSIQPLGTMDNLYQISVRTPYQRDEH